MPIRNYDHSLYAQDFPVVGTFNWKVAYIKKDRAKMTGVHLHDGKFMINGVLFDKNEFKIVMNYPPWNPPRWRRCLNKTISFLFLDEIGSFLHLWLWVCPRLYVSCTYYDWKKRNSL